MERQRTQVGRGLLQAARPMLFTVSLIPVTLGAALALRQDEPVRWALFPLIALASVLLHAATNMLNDYYDFRKGVDGPDTLGSSRVLVDGLLTPRQLLLGGLATFAATAAVGLVFVAIHGWPILVLGLVGIAGGFFYTASPLALKYLGLGDLCVFILMGPLMVLGSFFVLTGHGSLEALVVSLPIGSLVAAILSGNNLRDIAHDTAASVRTTAGRLGRRWAQREYTAQVISAYVFIVILTAMRILPFGSLATLLTLPLAVRNIRLALTSRVETSHLLAAIDIQTAQVHLLFGLLLIASIVLGRWL